MARLEGFEPTTYGLEVRSSIHLSYRRLIAKYTTSLSFGQGRFAQPFNLKLLYFEIKSGVTSDTMWFAMKRSR